MEERPDLDDPARAIFSNVATGWKHLTWSSWSLRASESDTRVTHTHTHACTHSEKEPRAPLPPTRTQQPRTKPKRGLHRLCILEKSHKMSIYHEKKKMQQAHTTPTTRPRCFFSIHVSTSLVMQYRYYLQLHTVTYMVFDKCTRALRLTTWNYLIALCCYDLSLPALTFYRNVATVQVHDTCDFVSLEREREYPTAYLGRSKWRKL
jgi:hypothetical protein